MDENILSKLGIPTEGLLFCNPFPPYNPALLPLARELRTHGTKTEAMMWKILKNRQTGYLFTRQKPILNFIADFYCHELRAVVEIDGATHFSGPDHDDDIERDRQMNAIGLKVVRIIDHQVRQDPIVAARQIFFDLGIDIPEL
ncbi:MAG: endonuclease domain-containing protein [Bacteroidales bacterium]|nr:endonuclease domain-containing protein [Bacteroidales bacterium]